MQNSKGLRALITLLALAFALTACGGGEEEPADDASETETASEAAEAGEELEVTGVDYEFQGVPETVEPGTKLTFTNASEKEAHEMVLLRINDGEERPLEELLKLPQEETQNLAQFQGVAFGFPGEETMYPDGDTTVTEAGRYAIVCFIPVGADVEAIKKSMQQQQGPPDMGDGPPHFTQGMAAEFTVS